MQCVCRATRALCDATQHQPRQRLTAPSGISAGSTSTRQRCAVALPLSVYGKARGRSQRMKRYPVQISSPFAGAVEARALPFFAPVAP